MIAPFRLLLYDPLVAPPGVSAPALRTDQLLIDPRTTTVQLTQDISAGFGALTVGIPRNKARQGSRRPNNLGAAAALLDDWCHVRLLAGSAVAFEGQVVRISRGRDGLPAGFVAEGYGVSGLQDGYLDAVRGTAGAVYTSGQLVTAVLLAASPFLRPHPSQFVDPGVQHALAEFDGASPSDVLGQVRREGDGQGTLVDTLVFEDALLRLVPRVAPSDAAGNPAPDYHLPYRPGVDSWDEDSHRRTGAVAVRYTRPGESTPQTLTLSNPGWSGARARTVLLNGGTLSDRGARAFATTYLANHAAAEVAILCVYGLDEPLRRADGALVPAWLARVGEWAQIGDRAELYPLTRVDLDTEAKRVQLKFGTAPADAADVYHEMRRVAAAVKAARNPVSGGRS